MPDEVRQRIIKEACHYFFTSGIRAVTMDTLSSRMGISKRTIYEHFRDKDEVLTEVLQYHKSVVDLQAQAYILKAKNVLEIFYNCYAGAASAAHLSQGMRLLADIRKYHPKVFEQVLRLWDAEQQEHIRVLLQRGVDEGFLREDVRYDIAVAIWKQQVEQMYEPEKSLTQQFSPIDLYEYGWLIMVRGLCTAKGLKEVERILAERNLRREQGLPDEGISLNIGFDTH